MSLRRPDSPVVSADRVISMTELQKLSLRKLREMRLHEEPLVVRDVKRDRRLFVILHHEVYRRLVRGAGGGEVDASGFEGIDFAGCGLLWDRPTMTNERFARLLGDSEGPDYRWAWARVLTRLPSRVVTRAIGLADLRRIVTLVSLRSRVRDAWEGAIGFWTEEAGRRLA